MKTVLLNMFLNAVQAMPDGGTLKVSIRREGSKIITVTEDSGTGIAEDVIDKVFDLYYTTRSEGTGLGLPLAHQIVKEHDGSMIIESHDGVGTKVRVELPVS